MYSALFWTPLENIGVAEELVLSGSIFPSPDGQNILDCDQYSVPHTSVDRVRLNSSYTEGEVFSIPLVSGLSTATVAEGELYVIKKWNNPLRFGAPTGVAVCLRCC